MSLSEKSKNLLSVLLRLGVSAVLLIVLFTKIINVEKTIQAIKQANLILIFYAFIPFSLINALLLIRWRVYIVGLGLDVSIIAMVRYFFLGLFGNLFLPSAIGGDMIKTIGLCGSSSQKPTVVASVLLDRLSGFAGMILVAFISFIF